MIKHIFSDMDGTLLQSDGKISENNVRVIKESQIPFTLVSARSPQEMTEVIAALDLTEPQIAFNGALIFQETANGRKYLKSDQMAVADVTKIVEIVQQEFPLVSCSFYDWDTWCVEKIDAGIEMEIKFGGQTPTMVDYVSLLKQPDLKILKIMLICQDLQEMPRLVARLKGLNLNLAINQSSEDYLEITSVTAEKSRGVEYVKELETLEKADLAAFGDGFNDVAMLQEVGCPIVMANALPGVKKYGRYLTKDNDHDGVAYGISTFLLN